MGWSHCLIDPLQGIQKLPQTAKLILKSSTIRNRIQNTLEALIIFFFNVLFSLFGTFVCKFQDNGLIPIADLSCSQFKKYHTKQYCSRLIFQKIEISEVYIWKYRILLQEHLYNFIWFCEDCVVEPFIYHCSYVWTCHTHWWMT